MFGDLLKMLYNMLKVEEMPSWRHLLVKAYFKVWSILRLKDSFTVKHCFLSPTSYVQSTAVLFLPRTSLGLTRAKGLSWRGVHCTESQKNDSTTTGTILVFYFCLVFISYKSAHYERVDCWELYGRCSCFPSILRKKSQEKMKKLSNTIWLSKVDALSHSLSAMTVTRA